VHVAKDTFYYVTAVGKYSVWGYNAAENYKVIKCMSLNSLHTPAVCVASNQASA